MTTPALPSGGGQTPVAAGGEHPPEAGQPPPPLAVIRSAARAFERDRYLAALLAPEPVRDDLITLAAFAGEIGRIPATISEPMMAAVRLQWWRDAVGGGAAAAGLRSGHPIADALVNVVARHALPSSVVLGLIDAHDGRLDGEPPEDDLALQQHLAKTEGAQFELVLRVLGGRPDGESCRPALAAAAQAYGLARLLVELPALTAEGRTLLPGPRLASAGVGTDELYGGGVEVEARLTPMVEALVAEARAHLAAAAAHLRGRAPHHLRLALLPLATVSATLEAVMRCKDRPLSRLAELSPLTRILRLSWTRVTGRL